MSKASTHRIALICNQIISLFVNFCTERFFFKKLRKHNTDVDFVLTESSVKHLYFNGHLVRSLFCLSIGLNILALDLPRNTF